MDVTYLRALISASYSSSSGRLNPKSLTWTVLLQPGAGHIATVCPRPRPPPIAPNVCAMHAWHRLWPQRLQ